jgi:hypothetical protein
MKGRENIPMLREYYIARKENPGITCQHFPLPFLSEHCAIRLYYLTFRFGCYK